MTQQQRRPRVYHLQLAPIVALQAGVQGAISDWPRVIRIIADEMKKVSAHVTKIGNIA